MYTTKKNFYRCAYNDCGRPCGHYYISSDVADPDINAVFYSWCWVRGKSVKAENGNTVENSYYCCLAHFEGRPKRGETDNEGEE